MHERRLIHQLVNAEYLFGDGPPTWLQGRSLKAAETGTEADHRRKQLVKVLRRHGRMTDGADQLAAKLHNCRPGARCLSGACPSCSRAFQRLLVKSIAAYICDEPEQWIVLSVIPAGIRPADGALATADLFGRLRKKLSSALRSAGIEEAIGGFDISLNEHRDGAFKPHWRPHAWIFVKTSNAERLRADLRSPFPKKGQVLLPIVLKKFDGNLRAIAYAFKTEVLRRVTIPADLKKDSRRNTRYRPLLARQKVELALALDRIGLTARLFAIGIDIDSETDIGPIQRSTTLWRKK
jgi:hypothetical protein